MITASAALELNEVSFGYTNSAGSGNIQPVLQDFSLSVPSGRITALMGSSGSGKSTIAKVASGIIAPHSGKVFRNAEFVRSCDVVYIDQAPLNSVFPWLDVGSNLTAPLRELGWNDAETAARVAFVTDTFHLRHVLKSKPRDLSGGELQRLALARSLSWQPRVAIVDETLSSLDPPTRKLILQALRRIVIEDHLTLVLITHYPQDALELADRIVVLGGCPALILDDFEIGLPFPRPITSPEYDACERRIGHSIGGVNLLL